MGHLGYNIVNEEFDNDFAENDALRIRSIIFCRKTDVEDAVEYLAVVLPV